MSYVDYEKAQKLGLKAFKSAVAKGDGSEYLPVLDEILENVDIQSEVNLGLVQIPLDKVVGTSNVGRTYAFANNFMPILDYKTEFGSKWSNLCDSQLEEGIRDPIKVYEYLNKFYVIEGNKRVSVLKYFEAVTVPAFVTRKVPKKTDDPEIVMYYEFMDFYKLTGINYLNFSQPEFYKKILELTCDDPAAEWTEDQQKDFGSAHHNFNMALKSVKPDKLDIVNGDAFLIFIDIYGYNEIKNLTQSEMSEKITPLLEEFKLESQGRGVELHMEPTKTARKKFMDYFTAPKKTMVAFVFDKNPEESDWLYGHELGRLYLEENCSDQVKTIKVHNLNTEEEVTEAMEDLIMMGVDIIFTTSSIQANASLKVAAMHPEVVILNCSLNSSYKLIRTYYARLYEVKFLTGMIAGALARNGKIGYLADYPIFGMPANINAFAIGANMVNPDAKVYLEWTTVKGVSRETAIEHFKKQDISYVSDQVSIKPGTGGRFGLYSLNDDNNTSIAAPVYHWGVFYKKLIDSILSGTFEKEQDDKAINYWWGLSAGVVDLIYSSKIPEGTMRLVNTIKKLIVNKEFFPFCGKLMAQDGETVNEYDSSLSPVDIMKMDWLVENIVGEIPTIEKLKDDAKSIVELKGVTSDKEEQKSGEQINENTVVG